MPLVAPSRQVWESSMFVALYVSLLISSIGVAYIIWLKERDRE